MNTDERTALEKSLDIALSMKGINRKQLAAKMECTGAYITKIMTDGRMSLNSLVKVCNALDVKVWEFIKLGEE